MESVCQSLLVGKSAVVATVGQLPFQKGRRPGRRLRKQSDPRPVPELHAGGLRNHHPQRCHHHGLLSVCHSSGTFDTVGVAAGVGRILTSAVKK